MGQQASDNGSRWRMRVVGLDEGSLGQLKGVDREGGKRIKGRSDCNRMRPLPINAEESKSTKKMVFGKKVSRRNRSCGRDVGGLERI